MSRLPQRFDSLPGEGAVAFTMRLARALHAYGTSADRLEEAMTLVSRHLGLQAQFFSTPTAIFAAFGQGAAQQTYLLRIEPGDVNLEKLARLDELIGKVSRGEVSPSQATSQVEEIASAAPRYGELLSVSCFGLSSACAARFFGGGWREIAVATLAGLLLGLLAQVFGRERARVWVFEPVAANVASLLAVLASATLAPLSVYTVTLAGLIVLIPGLTLTIAIIELATRNLSSGTSRLSGAGSLFLVIGFGVALGQQLGQSIVGRFAEAAPLPLPGWTEVVALALAPLGFTVLFQARPRDTGWILGAGVLAFGGARFGAWLLGPELGGCLGALAVGIACNLYARALDRPAVVPLVPGIMLLVPGSLGFRSLSALLTHDVLSGVETASRMVLVAVGLVTGLLLANVALPPRKAL
jgi:uncharacterized membrane protein YjjP (DUF1212 family)